MSISIARKEDESASKKSLFGIQQSFDRLRKCDPFNQENICQKDTLNNSTIDILPLSFTKFLPQSRCTLILPVIENKQDYQNI